MTALGACPVPGAQKAALLQKGQLSGRTQPGPLTSTCSIMPGVLALPAACLNAGAGPKEACSCPCKSLTSQATRQSTQGPGLLPEGSGSLVAKG